jgi:hypothetical protein
MILHCCCREKAEDLEKPLQSWYDLWDGFIDFKYESTQISYGMYSYVQYKNAENQN